MLKEVREARLKEYREKFISENESVLRNLMGFCLDERGKNIHMIVDDSLSSRTDGKTIWVSLLEPFLDPKYNSAFWTLIMKALLAHECQHINSTLLKEGFAMADKFAEWFEKNHGIDNRIGKNIAADMFNIIEDARIENIIVHNHPGWTMMFKIMNGEIRASGKILEIAEDPRTEFKHFRTQILSYAVCGGNAIGIDLYSGHRMEKEFDKIRGMIDKAVESYSCQECIDETFTVLCTIAPYLAELMKDDNALMQQWERMMNSISGGNDEIDFNGQSSSGGNGLRTMANRKPNPNMTGTFSDKELQQRGYTEDEMRRAIEMVRQEMEDWGTESVKRQSKSRAFRGNVTRIKEDKGTKFSEVKIVCGKSPLPADLKKRGEKLKREISYILKTKFHDRRGLKNGRLDERSLWRVPCKQENVFIKRNSRKKNSVVIYLLIDNSGSMDEKSKHLYAMQVAAILEEAIGETVPMKIVLFNSGLTKVTHYIVKDYEDHGKFNHAYNSLNAIVPDDGNRDGYSIRVATNDLSKRKEKNKILLVLSDGLPSVYSSREEGIQDVKTAVKNARAMGIEVIAMPFGSKDFIKKAMNDFVEMYETNIIAAGIDNIGKIMCNLFKKLITK